MELEMRAREDIGIGEDITPPLPPLSFALHDSLLLSSCSACFSAVSSSASLPPTTPFVVYCSAKCASADSPLHFSSAEHHLFLLLHHRPSSWPHGDSSDLRASLRLLRRLELLHLLPTPLPVRIAGLMTNRERLTSSTEDDSVDDDSLARIKDGATAMAMSRAMREGREFDGDCDLEEAVMCIVLTNALEVQIGGERSLGIAVYDGRFSWINHSCSPNACYRFALCSEDSESSSSASLRISPATQGIQVQVEDESVYSMCELAEGCSSHGPRLVVRSIKMMKRGDQVAITYTDLVQPRMLRQSDLWFKYQFLCSCIRCNMVPLSFVDHALQETLHVDVPLTMTSSVSRDRFVEEMKDYFDSVISEYMSAGNPKSCCEKIENLLIGCLLSGDLYLKKPIVMDFRLSPIHHMSLSAYTVLSSAYKIQSGLTENASKAFNMSRIGTAYSLLLAGATHHLFISEPSLIASAANFWTNAGESLVCLSQTSFWPSSVNQSSPNSLSLASLVCDNCLLKDKFKASFSRCIAGYEELNKVSQHFLQCMTSITPKVWSFLVQDCSYLVEIEDPINFSWLESLRTSNVWKFPTQSLHGDLCSSQGPKGNGTQNGEPGLTAEARTNTFFLGVHCMIYGCYLSGVCYGQDSSAANYARKILCG